VRSELESLARDGRWTDLHDMASRLASDPNHAAFVNALRQALDGLDFDQIRHLANATPSAP
jgi:hypothetical protein